MIPATVAGFEAQSLVDVLRYRAIHQPNDTAFVFLQDGEDDEETITFAQLDRWARAIAYQLEIAGASGERALLLFPPGLQFIQAFFGCLYAQTVAVPAYPPRLNRPTPRIQNITLDSQAKYALTTGAILSNSERRLIHTPELSNLEWIDTERAELDQADSWNRQVLGGDSLAYLQYTSGSTSSPKGVMISHNNLLHNLAMIHDGFEISDDSVGVFWLPNYHDMGLIGSILEPLYVGGPSILMSPTMYLQRPVRWFEAISRYRGTISGAPNFAYQLCVDKVSAEQCQDLDLSSWRTAFCGAETVRPETLETFAAKFEPFGFNRQAFYPCFGLAEGTLLATGGDGPSIPTITRFNSNDLEHNIVTQARSDDTDFVSMVGCGHPLHDQIIRIVNPEEMTIAGKGKVGEIWVSGPSVAQGYWGRTKETEEVFGAFIKDTGEGPFLRTGDLGFMHDYELYITGRIKDLIVIRGRNHYPQDIELTAEQSHEALETGSGSAFSIDASGEERLVIVNEVARRHRNVEIDEVVRAIRNAVFEVHGLQVHSVVLVKPLSVPKTSSGKIQRKECKRRYLEATLAELGRWDARDLDAWNAPPLPIGATFEKAETKSPDTPIASTLSDRSHQEKFLSQDEIVYWLTDRLRQELKVDLEDVDTHKPFAEFGLDSVQAVSLTGELERLLSRELSPTLIWDYPNIEELSAFLASSKLKEAATEQAGEILIGRESIAVIGLGCRFPGAENPEEFWNLLEEGIDGISEVPKDRWDVGRYYDAEGGAGKLTTKYGGFLRNVDQFDPRFFGITPREASRMDPQQRLLLEVAWEALENAAVPPNKLAGSRTGVFVGISSYDYSRLQFSDPNALDIYAGTGNAHSIAANRLSYILDLHGPSMAIDTACSSSLVAIHGAMQSLRSGESDLVIAGGVNLLLLPELTISFSQGQMMAPDGHCKTFDARADGYVRSEGCGIVVLKRLSDATRDGDKILAVLRGSAVNQDGRSNGLTAPNGLAQQAVIRQALDNANLMADQIDYVEAHGTGTALGDPIEIHSLRKVLDEGRTLDKPYVVGSVKSNIGHLEAAAGIAGLIKVILALENEEIPQNLHYQELNPHINLENSSLVIASERRPWLSGEGSRYAGVSSFGFGGTNAHLILSDFQPDEVQKNINPPYGKTQDNSEQFATVISSDNNPYERTHHVLALSAKSQAALQSLAERYIKHLNDNPDLSLADICYTANTGREHFDYRLAIVASSTAQLKDRLSEFIRGSSEDDQIYGRVDGRRRPNIGFLFTGLGAQYVDMGRQLYETQPTFRAALDHCVKVLDPYLKHPLLPILFPEPPRENGEAGLFDRLDYTQPALFALEYSLVELWRSWGIEPEAVMGHSMGEYVAAFVAGSINLEDGLSLISARGRLMQSAPGKGMTVAVLASKVAVEDVIVSYESKVSIAAVNGPESTVVSGHKDSIVEILSRFNAQGIRTKILPISHAMHSAMMDPVLDQFEQIAGKFEYRESQIPLVSNLSGKVLGKGDLLDAQHWRRHLRQPVEFMRGIQSLTKLGVVTFIEIGPKPSLIGMARQCLTNLDETNLGQTGSDRYQWLPSLRKAGSDWQVMLNSLATLYVTGATIDWIGFDADYERRKVSLPTYPFERSRYWIDIPHSPEFGATTIVENTLLADLTLQLFEEDVRFADNDLMSILQAVVKRAAESLLGENHLIHEDIAVTGDGLELANSDKQTKLHTLIIPEKEGRALFRVLSANPDGSTWTTIASGKIIATGDEIKPETSPAADKKAITEVDTPFELRSASLSARIIEAEPETQLMLIEEFVSSRLAKIIGLEREEFSHEQALDTLGIDSLMAMEMNRILESQLDVSLPVARILEGPAISELASELLQKMLSTAPDVPPIEPNKARGGPQPLSYNQQALWFLHELMPTTISFNVAGAVAVTGKLNAKIFETAFRQLVERHASLQTRFFTTNGFPQQEFDPTVSVPMQRVDASAWSEDDLQSFLVQQAYAPFDLKNGPVIRLILISRTLDEYVILLSMDHMIADLWSVTVMIQELTLLYRSGLTGVRSPLGTTDLAYTDYVDWERALIDGPQGEILRSYWLKRLAGHLPVLDLPTDYPRPTNQTYNGDLVSEFISPELTEQLQELSRSNGSTLYMTLLAAFQTLLHRYSGQDDLLVGSVLSGRDRPELAGLVGYFINPVALRVNLSTRPTFKEFLRQVREIVLGALANQNYPLPLLANLLEFSRDPSRPPLFETMFIMQQSQQLEGQSISAFAPGMPEAVIDLGEFSIKSMPLGLMPAQFDITMMVAELNEGLGVTLHYNSDLFNAATMSRMLDAFQTILRGIIDDPGQEVRALPLLPDDQSDKLLKRWNNTANNFPSDLCLQQLFEIQVKKNPDRTAIIFEEQALTYQELDVRSNQLAHYLQEMGVDKDVLVGVLIDRSLEMMVALFGVLKAGGAYIPLDPEFPAARVEFMLRDAAPRVLITNSNLLARFSDLEEGIPTIELDRDWDRISRQSESLPICNAGPRNLAYVIYTSGSTGRPKGVQIEHRGVVNFLSSMGRKPGLESTDVLVAVTTLSFDIAVLELFLPLAVGGKAVIVSREVAIDGLQLMQVLDDAHATIMQATPATWQMLLEAGWSGNSRLKILCGGEALPPNLANQLLGRGKELWNLYGPTETTIWSTASRIEKATEAVSIGYPIDNTQIYIVDDNLQPVPIGVVGRLFIGGIGVARGYLNRPALTADRFIRDPFSVSSDAIIYDTGDQARYEVDGKISFLGRSDNQVKIRGYRVELGEIEAALVEHSLVRRAVVIASGANAESKLLVAYLVLDSDVDLAPAEEWRDFLKEQLPDYMIPAAYVKMNEFPLTPNGKVDRKALPEPPTTRPDLSNQFVEPSTPLEQQLSHIMARVLEIDRVGISDSFFDLGGNSLLATRLIFQVRELTQVQLPLRHLFVDPTVRGLAKAVEASLETEAAPSKNGSGVIHLAATMSVDELNAEAYLEPTIEPGNLPKASILDPDHVFLTGATGFIGAFLLNDLLEMTSAHVHCLVRAQNPADGEKRIKQNLDSYGLWKGEYRSRIVAHPGDLARPKMGLPPDEYNRLAKLVDVIYHNGALVNFVYSYEVHRNANVVGTKEVLKLASQHRLKAVHFVSTLSVLHTGTQENGHKYYEDVALDQVGVPIGGYAQSKWVAEKLMLEAGRRGFPIAIFRPGPVAGDSVSGTWNTADMITNMARASMVIGAVPMLDMAVDIVPVNYVSSAIVALSLKDHSLGRVFHLSNPQPMPYPLLLDFLDEQGISLEKVTFDEWRDRLLNLAEGMGDIHSAPFMPLLEEVNEEQLYWPHFDCQNAISGLKDTAIKCEPVGHSLMYTYLSYLKNIGFLPTANSY